MKQSTWVAGWTGGLMRLLYSYPPQKWLNLSKSGHFILSTTAIMYFL